MTVTNSQAAGPLFGQFRPYSRPFRNRGIAPIIIMSGALSFFCQFLPATTLAITLSFIINDAEVGINLSRDGLSLS